MSQLFHEIQFFLWEIRQHLISFMPSFSWIGYGICVCVIAAGVILARRFKLLNCSNIKIVAMALYGAFLLYITLLGRSRQMNNGIWESFMSAVDTLQNDYFHAKYSLFFNIMLFVPIGMLFYQRKECLLTMMHCVTLTIAIESIQQLSNLGQFEIMDILTNSCGSMIGIAFCCYLQYLCHQKKRKQGLYNSNTKQ